MGLEQVLNNPLPKDKKAEKTIREILERRISPDTVIYIVRRQDLGVGESPALSGKPATVVVKKLVIPLSAVHFVADYENPNGQITLHIAHTCAWNVGEWITSYDESPYPPYNPMPKRMQSMVSSQMDIGRLGRYVIDGERGEKLQSKIIYTSSDTWSLTGLYAYQTILPSGKQPQRLDNIYWISFGLWQELIPKFLVELYKDYKYREISCEDFLNLAKQGVPSSLFRVKYSDDFMNIVDSYKFPAGYIGGSPQFIPRQGNQGDSTDGYLICTVFTPDKSEYWIFDGKDLAKGAICKLSHPDLSFSLTLHTAWLPKIGKRQADYCVPVREDYQDIVDKCSQDIKDLFEKEIYPHFESKN